MQSLTWAGFGLRALFATLLVFATFNPSGYSYFHWLKNTFPAINPYIALCGLVLIIGWAIYIRATLRSLGAVGIALASLLLGCIVWVFIDLGWFNWKDMNITAWVGLVIEISGVIGMRLLTKITSSRHQKI